MNKALKVSLIAGMAAATLTACSGGSSNSGVSTVPTMAYVVGSDQVLGAGVYAYTVAQNGATLAYAESFAMPDGVASWTLSGATYYNNSLLVTDYNTNASTVGNVWIYELTESTGLANGTIKRLPTTTAQATWQPSASIVVGNNAYISDYTGEVWRYQVQNESFSFIESAPALPTTNTAQLNSIASYGNYVYVVDVENQGNYNPVNRVTIYGGIWKYTIAGDGSLESPVYESGTAIPPVGDTSQYYFPYTMTIQNGLVYVTDYYSTVFQFSINSTGDLVYQASYQAIEGSYTTGFVGAYAFIGNYNVGQNAQYSVGANGSLTPTGNYLPIPGIGSTYMYAFQFATN